MRFDLGAVSVMSNRVVQMGATTNAETINQTEKESISDALNLMPGVLDSRGAKKDMVCKVK